MRAGKGKYGVDSGEFDFGDFDAPEVGISISDAVEETDVPDLAPPEAEVFYDRETGVWECMNCNYKYNPLFMGTKFNDLPSNWRCPDCKVSKDQFKAETEQVAGFLDNADYGLGFNTFTAAQKSQVIWGGLGLCVLGLLSGYALE